MPIPYQPLSPTKRQIRRLSVSAGEFDQPLCGFLDVVSLDDSPQYDALSYVWGENFASTPMVINNIDMAITENLDTALRYLRRRDKDRVLWVDAICIDQGKFG